MFRGRGGSNGRGRGQGTGGRGRGGGYAHAHDTTSLPAALRKELGIEDPADSSRFSGRGRGRGQSRGGHPTSVIGRKQARKDARNSGKKPPSATSNPHKRAREDAPASAAAAQAVLPSTLPPAKKAKVAAPTPDPKLSNKAEGKKKATSTQEDNANFESKTTQRKHVDAKTQTPLERLLAAQSSSGSSSGSTGRVRGPADAASVPKRKKRSRMTQAEKDEEDEIAWLEAHLGASKASGEDGDEDGLDGLIQDLDRYQTGMFDAESSGDDEDEDEDSSEAEMEEIELEDEDSESEMEEGLDGVDSEDVDEDDEDDEQDESDDEGAEAEHEHSHAPAASNPIGTSTAPDASASSSGKYIPPALRKLAASQASSSASLDAKPTTTAAVVDPKLQRTLNGLLNRLSSANLDNILADILAAYNSYPRAIVTQTLVRLVLETVALQPNLVDSIVIMYAALFASLGRSVGVEFGAEATQVLMGRLVHAHAQIRRRQRRASGSSDDVTVANPGTSDDDSAGRECMNLAVLLGHTYNLHLVAAPLIYDIVRLCLREPVAVRAGRDLQAVHLQSAAHQAAIGTAKEQAGEIDQDDSSEMCEIDVEVLLKLVKACGAQMRSDDPSALRDIVALTQERVSSSSSSSTTSSNTNANLGSRARFMLEALTELQKSRPKSKGHHAMGADGTVAVEALARYKKYIAGMVKRPERLLRSSAAAGVSATDEPLLQIRLRDLADSTKKGRWWLVGAAWTGHGDEEEEEGPGEGVTAKRKLTKDGKGQSQNEGGSGSGSKVSTSAQAEAGLLALAREHGMNTDARRSVFVTLMSSEDFVDASQRLLGLGLNEVQRREVVRVLLHCLGSEPIYNPYYVLVGQQLASESGAPAGGGSSLALSTTSNVISTRVTLQYCLWDYFREIGEKEVGGASMIASDTNGDGDEDEFLGFGDGDDAFGGAGGGDDEGGLTGVNRKMIHLARAYGWWIAKGALNLNMLRTVNFAGLKKRGRAFAQLLLCHVLLSIQAKSPTKTLGIKFQPDKAASRYRSVVEQILVRGTAGNLELARGLLIFVKRHLRPGDLGQILGGDAGTKGSGTRQALEWAVGVTVEVLEVGIQVAGQV
ncbi:suppressor of glycerol defect [Tilletia horrida]|uniref:Suppressor of glycerol defect n=1 Tax=Tilletia horrida TaxID=155126 RepID=A0AAN6JQE3_9BASI|nr:suppressor of glycerol defect [Tilletia horrida]KAK0547361.1 suppressor of glycerol defect [Tilletia horrida]KAK0562790.1 suppressor of glycerol defect [Tilletia horrida]